MFDKSWWARKFGIPIEVYEKLYGEFRMVYGDDKGELVWRTRLRLMKNGSRLYIKNRTKVFQIVHFDGGLLTRNDCVQDLHWRFRA